MDIATIILIGIVGIIGYHLQVDDIEQELEKQPVRIKKDEDERRK